MDITEILTDFFTVGKRTREIETQTEFPILPEIKEESEEQNETETETKSKNKPPSFIHINSDYKTNITNFIKKKDDYPVIFLVKDEKKKQELKKQLIEGGEFDCTCVNSAQEIILKNDSYILIDLDVIDYNFDYFVDTLDAISDKGQYDIHWVIFSDETISKTLLTDIFNVFKKCQVVNGVKKLDKVVKDLQLQ